MCGIVGYIGSREAQPLILEGLRRLEYRGYDSAGIAAIDSGALDIRKEPGKIAVLEKSLEEHPLTGSVGIGHTRWATHGAPTRINAHPHTDDAGRVALVHNGIIENHEVLRLKLEELGHEFRSQTDTEVLCHMIEEVFDGNLEDAVAEALSHVKGAYGIAVIHLDDPGKIVVARMGSPLLIGIGENGNQEMFAASDVAAVVEHTRQVVYLNDGEMAVLTQDGHALLDISESGNGEAPRRVIRAASRVDWDLGTIERAGYEHFMLKEIFEQPDTVRDAMRGRLLEEEGTAKLGGLLQLEEVLDDVDRIVITACGTSWHAALVGEYMLEEFARVPVEVEYASEFRYRRPIVKDGTLVIAISQSGETADTLAAMHEARSRGAPLMGIVNVVGSSIARETDGGVYIHSGPEIGVASTKAFTGQLTVLALFTLYLARRRGMPVHEGREIVDAMRQLPELVQRSLDESSAIECIAREYADKSNFLYLGRGFNFPVALEGALKLKEISYIHAEGYPAAEMKHGPIALIDDNMPVVFIAPSDSVYHKVASNIEEVKARGGKVIAIVTDGNDDLAARVDHVVRVPATIAMLQPILTVIPLQLLAYHIAVLRGCDVDQPRNLAKSVTVE
ncbi:MAG: glutamine--fructose-6-phosphate transaminase (isomerizing) [Gemmatimonadetes bacterium]|nr:glutamine--fructose-6-phosphate transaminase (isomerizing) [Gemmatimonadota bacterium]NNK49334.1 glutamine--fructose-6-phosphate transaminase (isomerizing) [Gemmatimonadota bacterium]